MHYQPKITLIRKCIQMPYYTAIPDSCIPLQQIMTSLCGQPIVNSSSVLSSVCPSENACSEHDFSLLCSMQLMLLQLRAFGKRICSDLKLCFYIQGKDHSSIINTILLRGISSFPFVQSTLHFTHGVSMVKGVH